MRVRRVLIAVAAGLVLADASVVTLALPRLLRELDTSVEGVASVLGVYTVVLAACLLPAERLLRRHGARRVGAIGLVIFATASLLAAVSGSLELLLAARAIQAAGGAAALVAAFALLEPGGTDARHGRRLWLGAAVLAAALGPALGGALTEALSWRAIFYVQAPIALAAAFVCRQPHPGAHMEHQTAVDPTPGGAGDTGVAQPSGAGPRLSWGPAVALALVSAALTAVLFLLVLLLVAGWDVAPLRAALTVTAIPAGALAGSRVGGDARTRAAAGCALVGGGVLALAFLPDARLVWTLAPQLAAGLGMGMALPALGGELLPERDVRDAARLLTMRHVGIAVALVLLAPVVSTQLASATERARERGIAIVLDAKLRPTDKLRMAPALLAGVKDDQPRAGLHTALKAGRTEIGASDRGAYDDLGHRLDDTLVLGVGEAFRTAFLIAGALALLAAAALLPSRRRLVVGALAVAAALPVAYVGAHAVAAPEPVALRNPCGPRDLPATGGLQGFLQDRVLELLDTAACHAGSTREELVLALTSASDRRRFEHRHGVDPRSLSSVLRSLLS